MKKEQKELEAVEREEEERRSAAQVKKETDLRFRERARRQKKKLEDYYASLRKKAQMELYGNSNDSPLGSNTYMSPYMMEHDADSNSSDSDEEAEERRMPRSDTSPTRRDKFNSAAKVGGDGETLTELSIPPVA